MNLNYQKSVDRDYDVCGICDDRASTIKDSDEVSSVYSNVKRFSHHKFTVWRCPRCKTLHSKEAVDLDKYYAAYPMQQQKLDYGTVSAFKTRLKYLRSIGLKKGDKVLDYGCSNGLFADYLSSKGFSAEGYDPYVSEYSNPKVLNSKYDAVVSYDVIEHVADPAEFMTTMAGLLKEGGVLVVGTPNASEISLKNQKAHSLELHQPYHRHILTDDTLKGIAQNTGFSLLKIRRRFCFDTLYPFINSQFIWRYVIASGNWLDVVVDMPKPKNILANPSLIIWGLIGYLIPRRGSMVMMFRK